MRWERTARHVTSPYLPYLSLLSSSTRSHIVWPRSGLSQEGLHTGWVVLPFHQVPESGHATRLPAPFHGWDVAERGGAARGRYGMPDERDGSAALDCQSGLSIVLLCCCQVACCSLIDLLRGKCSVGFVWPRRARVEHESVCVLSLLSCGFASTC